MRTGVALLMGLCLGVAGTWFLSSDYNKNTQAASSAWAQTNPTAEQDKPWTAADLEEIAQFYENTAETLEDEALQYEQKAASITPLTDTKGFRRSALGIAAQSKWKQAADLRQLAAEHKEKAKHMYAKEREK